MKKSIEDAQTKRLERQASAERQKVYEDVFLEEMQHYIQYGATESKNWKLCETYFVDLCCNEYTVAFMFNMPSSRTNRWHPAITILGRYYAR